MNEGTGRTTRMLQDAIRLYPELNGMPVAIIGKDNAHVQTLMKHFLFLCEEINENILVNGSKRKIEFANGAQFRFYTMDNTKFVTAGKDFREIFKDHYCEEPEPMRWVPTSKTKRFRAFEATNVKVDFGD